ncbi:hypothetical protein [Pontibacter beigongshangensis]|uniref:hypothetical protein n=1 Tax=Pontibacter beigongshangensis TaxID=2574733 RepID=UPI00164F2D7E|nr:hypothetical protein [Pontibacter beigongshangensis]
MAIRLLKPVGEYVLKSGMMNRNWQGAAADRCSCGELVLGGFGIGIISPASPQLPAPLQ